MKIVIIGYSGSGKSTLADNLSRHYSIPKLHMDTLQFKPGWIDSDRNWMEKEMRQFLSDHRDWVIDGNYSWCCYEERMEQADQIIFLNFSRWNCLFRAWKRYRRYKGRVRESMAGAFPPTLLFLIYPWGLWDGRQARQVTRYQTIGQNYPDKFVSLKNQKELDAFLKNIQ